MARLGDDMVMDKQHGMLIVVSGFSGVGKGTVVQHVFQSLPNIQFSISCTTRKPRQGEENGVDYFFITPEQFERKIAGGEFVEYTKTFTNYYGTLKSEIDAPISKGVDVLLEVNVVGARNIKAMYPDCVSVFIKPPSLAALKARLIGRGSETPDSLARRLKEIESESREICNYDYVVTNNIACTCADEIVNIIRSEHLKVSRQCIENLFSSEE